MLHKEMIMKVAMLTLLTACLILLSNHNTIEVSDSTADKTLDWQME